MAYIVQHEREKCSGCMACVAMEQIYWIMNQDGKADLIGAKHANGVEELEVSELKNLKDSADACPVNAIHITDKTTGQKMA